MARFSWLVLGPRLQPGQVVVMNNLSTQKVAGVRQLIESRGAQLLYLPPYSPDFNPIEKAYQATAARRQGPPPGNPRSVGCFGHRSHHSRQHRSLVQTMRIRYITLWEPLLVVLLSSDF
jgi:transposase